MTHITKQLEELKQRISTAAQAAGRSETEVSILAVSKRHGPEALRAAQTAGLNAFGENYLQEALAKIPQITPPAEWHFIGRIQSNKTAAIARNFDWVQTLDSEKIARRLNDQRPETHDPLNVCIQICTDAQSAHGGVLPEDAIKLCKFVALQPNLNLRGLMTIPMPASTEALQREPFRQLKNLYDELRGQGFTLDTLSMGMSGDLDAAIAEGSTMIRIGTALFGPRPV